MELYSGYKSNSSTSKKRTSLKKHNNKTDFILCSFRKVLVWRSMCVWRTVVLLYICPGCLSEHHAATHSVCSETEHALFLSSHTQPQREIHSVKIKWSFKNKGFQEKKKCTWLKKKKKKTEHTVTRLVLVNTLYAIVS